MDTPYGRFQLLTDHNILICRVSDRWDLRCAERYVTEIQQQVSNMGNQPWCRVANMQDFQLASPDVIALMHDFGEWSLQHGCIKHVFMFSNPLQREQVRTAYQDLFDIREFQREQDAMTDCSKSLRNNFLRSMGSQHLAHGQA